MIIPLIYLYGKSSLNKDINCLTLRLVERYCLQDVSDEGGTKICLIGELVNELLFSKNLDYIKIDCSIEIFIDILFEFTKYLDESYKYSVGFSGDPEDIKPFPVFRDKQELLRFWNIGA